MQLATLAAGPHLHKKQHDGVINLTVWCTEEPLTHRISLGLRELFPHPVAQCRYGVGAPGAGCHLATAAAPSATLLDAFSGKMKHSCDYEASHGSEQQNLPPSASLRLYSKCHCCNMIVQTKSVLAAERPTFQLSQLSTLRCAGQ